MIETALGITRDKLKSIDVPYEFMRWTSTTIPDRYWVGEYIESPTDTEDGYEEGSLILTGTAKTWALLMEDRAKIKDHFPKIGGLRKPTDTGVVVIFYDESTPVPTVDANLKRIQITLQIKAWKGMK